MDGGDYGVNMPNIKDLQSSVGGRTFGDISECRSAEKKSKLKKLTAMSKNTTLIKFLIDDVSNKRKKKKLEQECTIKSKWIANKNFAANPN